MKVCVLGSGYAGLITAHVLLSDGFDVEIVTSDSTPGGVWSRDRVYPGLRINNVYGEYRFSCLPMAPPENTDKHMSGNDMCAYGEMFAERFLAGRFRYDTRVRKLQRLSDGWRLDTINTRTGVEERLRYDKLVLCTGACHVPLTPTSLQESAARATGFDGLVFHSRDFGSHLRAGDLKPGSKVVVVGGGRSAQDVAKHLANAGHSVSIVFEKADAFLAASPPGLPDFIRRSRFLSILMPHSSLDSRLERFLHQTRIGATIVHGVLNAIIRSSYTAMSVPKNSPLRNTHSLFWGVRINDEGASSPDSFFALVNSGNTTVLSPARVSGYASDGRGVQLADGRVLPADVVVLATGYKSSWDDILDDVRDELGLRSDLVEEDGQAFAHEWQYASMANPPPSRPDVPIAASIYRGLVPVKSLDRRDFAINGATFTTNNGYVLEISAHWISSYFLRDSFLTLPRSVDEASHHARRTAAWLRRRHPRQLGWTNESYSAAIAFWDWPQAMDELLEDMHLRTYRSGGNWLTWPFRVIDLSQIVNLGEERKALRRKAVAQHQYNE
ncbi:FAD/NAD-P-binding domain-containing protein [Peniophora sp. CONT]|nr:FAD/NAD-P-binding domain-containing protein [Peniophora sp. CONT]